MALYLSIPGLQGDVLSGDFKNQFQVFSMQWSGTNSSTSQTTGKPSFSLVSVSKLVTVHSPTLMISSAKWLNLGTIVVTQTLVGLGREIALDTFSFGSAHLSTISQAIEDGGQDTEILGFQYSRVEYRTLRLHRDGTLKLAYDQFWDIDTN